MCGLLGWVGKDPKDFNRAKFNIIGIANESRGTHSCGVSTDGKLFKGVGALNKKYTDFIINSYYDSPKESSVVIGHTRYATGGAHTEANAHPFKFENGDSYMIGAHNGIIKNIDELATKYGIEKKSKIDSEILLEIISKGELDVLEEYNGFAALLMHASNEPNTLWVFRGESKEHSSSFTTTAERPLYFYQESPTSMYLSSLQDPLMAIVDDEDDKVNNIKEFLTNTLYKIVDGSIEKRYKIDRTNRVQKPIITTTTHRNNSRSFVDTTANYVNNNKTSSSNNTASVKTREEAYPKSNVVSHKTNNIFYETVLFHDLATPIYYENLQYKHKGNPVSGIFIFIKECGLVKLTDHITNVDNSLKNFKYEDPDIKASIQFDNITGATLYYIFDGWLLKDELDYKKCMLERQASRHISVEMFSHMSRYPVIDTKRLSNEEKVYPSNQRIMCEGQLYVGILKPIGSFREYSIKFGDLKSTTEYRDFFIPDANTDNIISGFDTDVKWSETPDLEDEINSVDDASVFENDLSDKLFNESPDDNEDVQGMIHLNSEIKDLFDGAIIQISKMGEVVRESSLAKTFTEWCNDSMTRYEPISDEIKKWESTIEI